MMQLSSGATVCAVGIDSLAYAWPTVEPLLRESLEYSCGTIAPDDIYKELEEGLATLWIIEQGKKLLGVCIVQVVTYPRGRSLRIWALSGEDMRLWRDAIGALEAYGRAHQCRFIEAITRPGISRLTKDLGFSVKRDLVIKPLDTNTH